MGLLPGSPEIPESQKAHAFKQWCIDKYPCSSYVFKTLSASLVPALTEQTL